MSTLYIDQDTTLGDLRNLLVLASDTLDLSDGLHLLLDGGDRLGPSPDGDLALVQLVNLGSGAAEKAVSKYVLINNFRDNLHSPLSLGNHEPHENADGHGEGAEDEAGLDAHLEQHRRRSVASSNAEDRVDEEGDGTSLGCCGVS